MDLARHVGRREAGNKAVFLFIFEGLGTSELVLILVVALVIFGPRKLPQLSRSLGKSLADFKRASEDFKQTWQKEVDRENLFKEATIEEATVPEDRSILGENRDRTAALLAAGEVQTADPDAPSIPSSETTNHTADADDGLTSENYTLEPPATRKRDWL